MLTTKQITWAVMRDFKGDYILACGTYKRNEKLVHDGFAKNHFNSKSEAQFLANYLNKDN